MELRVSREQVLAYRVAAQGLHRDATAPDHLAVLDVGVQDSGTAGARLAFDARLAGPPPTDGVGPDRELALVWSLRGAPHVHRRVDLDRLAGALWPLSEADATARLHETGPSVARAGIPALQQLTLAVQAMRTVVTKPMGKGAASAAVTGRLPRQMWRDCRGCKAWHLSDSVMRLAAPGAGLELQPDTAPPVLLARPGAADGRAAPDVAALQQLIVGYLTVLGPATAGEVAGYLEARRADVQRVWPQGLAAVSVDGRVGWLPPDQVAHLVDPPPCELVRLLGPFDPYLQARDRALLVPDRAMHKALWPVLGRPGVLLVDGEVAGIWRPRAGAARLDVAVEAFAPLPPTVWAAIEAEAARVAAVRGATAVRVTRGG